MSTAMQHIYSSKYKIVSFIYKGAFQSVTPFLAFTSHLAAMGDTMFSVFVIFVARHRRFWRHMGASFADSLKSQLGS
jgi:hypothetical protein